ncbi:MAG TPA: porin [Nitrospirota bacterium]|nr:porin [Nitrospirota bacterium]
MSKFAKLLLIPVTILSLTTASFAQDFRMGDETKGLKVKISDDTDISIRIRMQPRVDSGDLIASKDGRSYESEMDMYLRRIRLEMDGKLVSDLKFNLTFEGDKNGIRGKESASKSNEVKVLYAYLDYKFADEANLRFGKAKLPFSRVSLTSSSKQLLIERPVSTEAAKKLFDDYYQTNAMLHGSFAEGVIAYNIDRADGWENGNYLNGKDATEGKVFKADPLYIARIEVSPPGLVEKSKSDAHLGQGRHLTLGLSYATQKSIDYSHFGSTYNATTGKTTETASNNDEDRSLIGADISAHFGGLTLQGEYIAWKIDYSAVGKDAKEPKGLYVQAGYFIPGLNIEPVARYEVYDHNSNAAATADNTKEKDTTIGVNWYGKGHSFKVGANWVHSTYEDNVTSDVKVKGSDEDSRDMYQLQAQLYF